MSDKVMRPTVQDLSNRELAAVLYDYAHEIAETEMVESVAADAILEARSRLLEAPRVAASRPLQEAPHVNVLGYLDAAAEAIDAASHAEDDAFHLATALVAIAKARALVQERGAPEKESV